MCVLLALVINVVLPLHNVRFRWCMAVPGVASLLARGVALSTIKLCALYKLQDGQAHAFSRSAHAVALCSYSN